MPTRMIRDWTSSKKVNLLSSQGERFLVRLMMKADDFGNYPASIKLINGTLFPESEDIRDIDVAKWLDECVRVGLLGTYTVDEKKYLHIYDFGQRLDRAKAKYPQPHEDSSFLAQKSNPEVSGKVPGNFPPELEVELEEEIEVEHESASAQVLVWPSFNDFWEKYDKKIDRDKCEKKWKKVNQGGREKIMQHLELYIRGTPDKQYRKNPATYLNNHSWENEIVTPNGTETGQQLTIDKGTAHTISLMEDYQRRNAGKLKSG